MFTVRYAECLPSGNKLSSIPDGLARGRLCSDSPGRACTNACASGNVQSVPSVEVVKDTVTQIIT